MQKVTTRLMPLASRDADWSECGPYSILSTGRSGNSYLCDLLTNTGVCGFPKEHLRDPVVYCLKHGMIDASELVRHIVRSDVLRICYEDLVESPAETLRQVMQHIGVHQARGLGT